MVDQSESIGALSVLFKLLKKGRFDYSDEKTCQEQIGNFLERYNIAHKREFSLGRHGICDFFFPRSHLVLEVKAGKSWSKVEVFRQCEKYLEHEDVSGLLLATGKIQGMPSEILGKPIMVYQLGLGLLP